jgi:4-hydroxy-tetrahydrodipicolinate reductase
MQETTPKKLNIAISGSTGKMGKILISLFTNNSRFNYIGGASSTTISNPDFLTVVQKADVLIDFSSPHALEAILKAALLHKKPLVIGTTGYTQEHFEMLFSAAKEIPILHSANFSLGIALCKKLIKESAKILGSSCDIGIIESHHTKKKDAPSGTALLLAKAIEEVHGDKKVPIHSIRAGNIVGEHSVYFCSEEERLTIQHEVQSRAAFAKGALEAANFLFNQNPGLYSLDSLFQLQ